ncbi:MAG: diphthamide synthesis protein [Nanoarchaeota archaeon]|nr:diphthamide synthesis protein [Nanoarchaeota archaeon]
MEIDYELDKVVEEIKENNAKRVLIQLPDGLKPRAMQIEQSLKEKTGVEIMIWLGSCFGACDLPIEVDKLGVDLILQFGHAEFRK